MGSRSRSTISRPRREHAADSAQRNWHRRQGEPSRGHENACRFRSSSRHDTQLGAGERRRRRSHASRAASVEHGPFALGAEQTPAARRDSDERAVGIVRPAYRERLCQWPPAKHQQDRHACPRARIRPARPYIPRRVCRRPLTARFARNWASAVEGTARCERRTTPRFGLASYAKCWLGTWHVHVEEPTSGRCQSKACAEGKLSPTTERRLGTSTSTTWAVWRLGWRCAEGRRRGLMIPSCAYSHILFGFSSFSFSLFDVSFAWLSTHFHDYYGRLWQYIYSGARVYDSLNVLYHASPFES
jgi:hypothetical protein